MDIIKVLAKELELKETQVENTVKLIDEGNTIPFIARYRKEVTGALDDEVLRKFYDRLCYLRSLDERREEIIHLIEEQGKMTEDLMTEILKAEILQELEDIYRPYRPKRRTKATIAKEKGLEPLAMLIYMQQQKTGNPYDFAKEYPTAFQKSGVLIKIKNVFTVSTGDATRRFPPMDISLFLSRITTVNCHIRIQNTTAATPFIRATAFFFACLSTRVSPFRIFRYLV
mgnify:CR=1 FL=1